MSYIDMVRSIERGDDGEYREFLDKFLSAKHDCLTPLKEGIDKFLKKYFKEVPYFKDYNFYPAFNLVINHEEFLKKEIDIKKQVKIDDKAVFIRGSFNFFGSVNIENYYIEVHYYENGYKSNLNGYEFELYRFNLKNNILTFVSGEFFVDGKIVHRIKDFENQISNNTIILFSEELSELFIKRTYLFKDNTKNFYLMKPNINSDDFEDAVAKKFNVVL